MVYCLQNLKTDQVPAVDIIPETQEESKISFILIAKDLYGRIKTVVIWISFSFSYMNGWS